MGLILRLINLSAAILFGLLWITFTFTGNGYFAIHGIIFAVAFFATWILNELRELREQAEMQAARRL